MLLQALAQVLREEREAAGLLQVDVAARASVDRSVITRLEGAKRWPRDPERLVAIYASECGKDPLALWERALEAAQNAKDPPPPKQ